MHILFLTQVLPYPLDAGPKIRAYYTLRYLASRHQVTLVSFVRSTDTQEAIAHLRTLCHAVHTIPMQRSPLQDGWHLLQSLLKRQPFLIVRDQLPAMTSLLTQLMEEGASIDAIHADQLWMASYAQLAGEAGHKRPQMVLDQHNAVFRIPERMARQTRNPLKRLLFSLEAKKLAHYEHQTCHQFDYVAWVTTEDHTALYQQSNGSQPPTANGTTSISIPICVDPQATPVVQRSLSPRRVTFLGGLHWPPNAEGIVWFASQVWPQILAQVPGAILTVIGKQPPPQLTATQLKIPASSLEVTGYAEDVMPFLEETAVFVVPLHAGGGMRVKILDAWCWGLPVVSTSIGAEGLAVHDGHNLLLADEAEAFADAVVHLLTKPEQAQQLGRAGRSTVESHYNWHHTYQIWDEVYPW